MISPTIQRKPKKKQSPSIKTLNQDNIKFIHSCLKSLRVVESILTECEKNKIQNIFVVDGPNMGFWKEKTFKNRELFLWGKKFRNVLLQNTIQTDTNLYLIISQKELTKEPTCDEMVSMSNMLHYKKQFFLNLSVACYDKKFDERCMVPNETDDFTRKYLSMTLLQKFRKYKKHVSIYEISNDESRNWILDSKFKVPRIPFPTTLFREKPTMITKTKPTMITKTKPTMITKTKPTIITKTKPTIITKTKPLVFTWKKKTIKQKQDKSPLVLTTKPTPSLSVRPFYAHINVPSGMPQQFGINPSIAKRLLQSYQTDLKT